MSSANPEAMLLALGGRVGDRTLRHFIVGCIRQARPSFRSWPIKEAWLDAATRFADCRATSAELAAARSRIDSELEQYHGPFTWWAGAAILYAASEACSESEPGEEDISRFTAVDSIASAVASELADTGGWGGHAWVDEPDTGESRRQADLLRRMLGRPFAPGTPAPLWQFGQDRAVRSIAQAIVKERAYGDLPVLADALEDAGCVDAEVLDHCRSGGNHVPGCWVLDRIRGRLL